MTVNWQVVGPILVAASLALNSVLAVVVAKWPNAPKWLRVIQAGLADMVPLLPGVPGSQTHAALAPPAPRLPIALASK